MYAINFLKILGVGANSIKWGKKGQL